MLRRSVSRALPGPSGERVVNFGARQATEETLLHSSIQLEDFMCHRNQKIEPISNSKPSGLCVPAIFLIVLTSQSTLSMATTARANQLF